MKRENDFNLRLSSSRNVFLFLIFLVGVTYIFYEDLQGRILIIYLVITFPISIIYIVYQIKNVQFDSNGFQISYPLINRIEKYNYSEIKEIKFKHSHGYSLDYSAIQIKLKSKSISFKCDESDYLLLDGFLKKVGYNLKHI